LLNCVRLQPGGALFLAAGNLHAYLGGTGIEIMAASDNVLRGGLTPKHIDVPELLRVVDFTPLVEPRFAATPFHGGHRFAPPVAEFSLHNSHTAPVDGPEIWLCTAGAVSGLHAGDAAFVTPDSGERPNGDGTVLRACVGAGSLTSG
jgi:mannose-6-phosphate isomerase